MEDEIIAVRWNSHLSTLSQLLASLRDEESLCDVTLACEGKHFYSHKFVLSMCSDFFKELFLSNPCKHPVVFMRDVKHSEMEALLDFMYKGVVHIPKDSLSDILKTAEALQIRGLGHLAKEASVSSPKSSHASDISFPSIVKRVEDEFLLNSDSLEQTEENVSFHVANKSRMPYQPSGPPPPAPDLPKVSDNTLDFGWGVHINADDYQKFRRTSVNRYINDLLRYFFPIEILASSSLTGGECFANKTRGPSTKNQIDPCIIRVITYDAMRNFPNVTEKQVRSAIRRKLNTEARLFRGLGSRKHEVRKKTKYAASSSQDKQETKDVKYPVDYCIQVPGDKSSQPCPVNRVNDPQFFNSRSEKLSSPVPVSSESSVPGHFAAANISNPSPSEPPVTTAEKNFNLIKSEISVPTQFISPEYSYNNPHISQTYLPHHSVDSYPRRLELNSSAGHVGSLPYIYPHISEPTNQNLNL